MSMRVYTSGVFDLFHVGHMRALQLAKQQGGDDAYLLVGVTSDASCEEYKRTPMIPYAQRREIIQGIHGVDEVIEAPNYPDAAFYQKHRIDLCVQGCDFPDHQAFYATAKSLGIMKFVDYQDVACTTEIIARVQARLSQIKTC